MNFELLLLELMARFSSLSHYDLSHAIGGNAREEIPDFTLEDAWNVIDDAKEANYIRDEWRNSFDGGTLWHLTEDGVLRLAALKKEAALGEQGQ
jgi:hypothetical protein